MQTLTYYNRNAKEFIEGTVNVDFQSTQDRFLKRLPKHASILDFGCGSGRDTRYFLSQGYQVDATDGSEELCRLASEYTGITVKQMLFQELDRKDCYDGIWACSSILHLAWDELLAESGAFGIEEQWVTSDARPDRREERWLNILLRKNWMLS